MALKKNTTKKEETKTIETPKEETTMNQAPAKINTDAETLDTLQDAMEIPGIDEVPRIKASQGSLINSEGDEVESPLVAEILSFSTLYVASTNEDSQEARKLTRYTYDLDRVVPDFEDPETTMTADEYVEHLKELGYKNAKVKKYLDILVMTDDDELYVIQASPQSAKQFNLYKVLANRKIQKGEITLSDAARIKVTPKKAKLGKFMFTKMQFSQAK